MTPKKFDIIIPVWNSPEWVEPCIMRLLDESNIRHISKLIIVDDYSNAYTRNLLTKISQKFSEKIELILNSQNLGFVKTVNRGLDQLSKDSDYVLIQNSDCFVPNNFFKRIESYFTQYKNCGLISPVSNNAANLSINIPEGLTFLQFDEYLDQKLKNNPTPFFEACTVIGNCLVISKKCIEIVGKLNEAYGVGYGEETDYQFRAMKKGFTALIAPNIFAYHQGGVSFGENLDSEHLKHKTKNHQLFMSEWKDDYQKLLSKYEKNDPINFLKHKISNNISKEYDYLFILPALIHAVGGIATIINFVNYLCLNGKNVGLVINTGGRPIKYNGELFLSPILIKSYFELNELKVKTKNIFASIWDSLPPAYYFAKTHNCHLSYFIQGYEPYFDKGASQGLVVETYRIPSHKMAVSNWLKNKVENVSNEKVAVLPFGYNQNLYFNSKNSSESENKFNILIVLRNIHDKGDWVAKEVITLIKDFNEINKINILSNSNEWFVQDDILASPKMVIHQGPINQKEMKKLYDTTDIYIDCSFHEGFGLIPLEVMATGGVVIASDSGGINDFLLDNQNAMIVKEVNKPEAYAKKLKDLVTNPQVIQTFKLKNSEIIENFTYQKTFPALYTYIENATISNVNIPLRTSLPEEQFRVLVKYKMREIQNEYKLAKPILYLFKALKIDSLYKRFIYSEKIRNFFRSAFLFLRPNN
ncbi:MAG: glycosyltransferase [Bacteriovoracaceae bacterium]